MRLRGRGSPQVIVSEAGGFAEGVPLRSGLVESRGGTEGKRPAVTDAVEARRFYVSGMVQGVGYRFFAQRVAERLGLAGYVKNLRDSRVEVYAIGRAEQLGTLRAELERGPGGASVSNVREERAEVLPEYADYFSIEHDW